MPTIVLAFNALLNSVDTQLCFHFAGVVISSSMMDPRSEERVTLQERESATSTLKRSDSLKRLRVTNLWLVCAYFYSLLCRN